MSDGGKGSKRRPTDEQKFDENFNKIFREKIAWEDEIQEERDKKRLQEE
jgi:hypothetical protein|tara:strand:- start:95 stop:241 length:147 start_codon:yes stop_codon:yes gene_type:complete